MTDYQIEILDSHRTDAADSATCAEHSFDVALQLAAHRDYAESLAFLANALEHAEELAESIRKAIALVASAKVSDEVVALQESLVNWLDS